jgi:ribonucleotide monophosphatase NagD (HAD superfamily)
VPWPRRSVSATGRSPIIVGDRLDTDILAARRAGLPSVLGLTGATSLADLLRAGPQSTITVGARVLCAAVWDADTRPALAAFGELPRQLTC